MCCNKTVTALAVIAAATCAAAHTITWSVRSITATHPNQGRMLVRNGNYVHLLFGEAPDGSDGDLSYTYSTNSGSSWASPEVIVTGDWYDLNPSIALTGNTPWAAWARVGDLWGYVGGGVRKGANPPWSLGTLATSDGPVHTTSTVMSPSGGTSPMAYTVYSTSVPGDPVSWCYVYFVAWDTLGQNRTPRQVRLTQVDALQLGPNTTYEAEASIAVSAYSGYDTIHICYKLSENGVDRIFYRKNTNAINPGVVRGGTSPTWSARVAVSTASNPITEPASEPSIEFYNTKVVVVWRGPNSSGQNIGEIYRRYRTIGSPNWSVPPTNISQTPTYESRHPESSEGLNTITFEDSLGPGDAQPTWEARLYYQGNIYNISHTGSTDSRYPHCVAGNVILVVWTENPSSGSYSVYYRDTSFIPSLEDGGQSSGRTDLNPPVLALGCSPNPVSRVTTISYDLPNPTHVRLRIYALSGQLMRTLVDEPQTGGSHTAVWDGRDEYTRIVPTGIYVCRLSANGLSLSKPITIAK